MPGKRTDTNPLSDYMTSWTTFRTVSALDDTSTPAAVATLADTEGTIDLTRSVSASRNNRMSIIVNSADDTQEVTLQIWSQEPASAFTEWYLSSTLTFIGMRAVQVLDGLRAGYHLIAITVASGDLSAEPVTIYESHFAQDTMA